MIDVNKIDVAEHEFTGDELGELLLQSVQQMKRDEFSIRTQAMMQAKETKKGKSLFLKVNAKLRLAKCYYRNFLGSP